MNTNRYVVLISVLVMSLVLSGCGAGQPPATPSIPTPTPPATQNAEANTIRLAIGDWPPFIAESAPHYGVYSHLVTEAFAMEGVRVEYGFFPWNRCLRYVEIGDEWDGSMPWAKSTEREAYGVFSTLPVAVTREVFFHRVDYAFDWQTEADLQGHRIGLILGYATTEQLETLRDEGLPLQLDVAGDELANLKKLLAGRTDVFPCDLDVCTKLLQANFTSKEIATLTYHPKAWIENDLYLLISRQSPRAEEWVQIFDRGMQKLKDSGRYAQMIQDFQDGVYDVP